MKMKLIGLCFGIFIFFALKMNAQCTPPSADSCHLAQMLCVLNGVEKIYCCTNPNYNNPTGCMPLCPQGGISYNTGWWAFSTMSGHALFSFTIFNCKINGNGLQFGILGNCQCDEFISCSATCTSNDEYVIDAMLTPCKTYYLFANGCSGDVCDFCLRPIEAEKLELPQIGTVSGVRSVCQGACNVQYSASVGSGCEPTYHWTLNGQKIGADSGEVSLNFPDTGQFLLCVSASIGNVISGSFCDQVGPSCATITVHKLPNRFGPPKTICYEQIPFILKEYVIDSNGMYRKEFTDSLSCCKFDSIFTFIILDSPIPPEVFYLACKGDTYMDTISGVSFSTCQFGKQIYLPNSTVPWKCDSSYLLNAVFLDYNVQFREYCVGGAIVIEARPIDRTITCGNSGLAQDIQYNWYRKNDPARRIIGNEGIFDPPGMDEYCVELSILANFGNQAKVCKFDYCEQWDESQFKPFEICPLGDSILTDKLRGNYFLDSMTQQGVFLHNWQVTGGTILTPMGGIDTTGIEVDWDPSASEHKVCYNYISNCGDSKECCLPVRIVSGIKDDIQKFDSWSVIPNPASKEIRVLHPSLQTNLIEVIDQFGKSAMKIKSNTDGSFDISNLNSGMYFLKIHSDEGIGVRRLIVFR
ncbi:MAG: T9SS type A sorting domain-containing protein [Saprospiraceae bacterium]|nr:T9SS type A sorting domain-containing protein [Saprospiraceae bacterium]MBK9630675.1 T9SS type A sorting domain-containing protein [Saprospiraceae bacterium]